jgi:hypothetical protein
MAWDVGDRRVVCGELDTRRCEVVDRRRVNIGVVIRCVPPEIVCEDHHNMRLRSLHGFFQSSLGCLFVCFIIGACVNRVAFACRTAVVATIVAINASRKLTLRRNAAVVAAAAAAAGTSARAAAVAAAAALTTIPGAACVCGTRLAGHRQHRRRCERKRAAGAQLLEASATGGDTGHASVVDYVPSRDLEFCLSCLGLLAPARET